MVQLLIVDDEQSICWGLARLAEQLGLTAATASSAEQALLLAHQAPPAVVMLDVRLPGMDGLAALRQFRQQFPTAPVIVMTAYGQLDTAVEAVRGGAFEYLTKPFDLAVAERAIRRALRAASYPPAAHPAPEQASTQWQIIGSSPPMQEVFKRIALVAPTEACVHLCGPSGSGKELVARAIHRHSRRAEAPFIAVNLAALNPAIVESELFGHVRGAFTGAEQSRKGLLVQAQGGTVFLDEVADIPLAVQVKLLRALEHGEVLPVGAEQPVETDFRLVSATNRNLAKAVAAGTFRHDLYYRLVTFEIVLPPLCERREDIGELAEFFLDLLAARSGVSRPRLSPETLAELLRRPWHGNVRELRNALEHAIIFARGGPLLPDHLPPPAPPPQPLVAPNEETEATIVRLVEQWAKLQLSQARAEALYERLLRMVEPPLLRAVMAHHQGQCAPAARQLGLHRTTLRKKLDQLEKQQP
jgi:two-component system nitrogen regulation response regulator GlnG